MYVCSFVQQAIYTWIVHSTPGEVGGDLRFKPRGQNANTESEIEKNLQPTHFYA